MSSTGTMTSISSGLRTPASTMVTGPGLRRWRRRGRRGSGRSRRAGAGWPTGRCAAAGASVTRVEPLEREREVGAPLGGGEGVDLVDDHGLDAAQRLAGRRREHQVERLGRGDEQVGRVAHACGGARRPGCRRCACRRSGGWNGSPEALGGEADAGERRPQVLLDVDGQGPQRRDVEQPGAVLAVVGRRRRHQPVDAPQEGGERLARAGGGQDQRVVARRDGRPALGLRRRWARRRWWRTRRGTGAEKRSSGSGAVTPAEATDAVNARSPAKTGPATETPVDSPTMAPHQPREWHPAFEEYCEAIFELREDDVDVIQARIAERLEVSRPAVSEMIRRMEKADLVTIDAGSIRLTDRRHGAGRAASCAATAWPSASSPTCSGCRWAEAHVEAGRWEHVISAHGRDRHDAGARATPPPARTATRSRAPTTTRPTTVTLDRAGRGPGLHGLPHPRGARVHPGPARVPRGLLAAARPRRHRHRRVARRHHHRRDRRPPVGIGSFASTRILVTAS